MMVAFVMVALLSSRYRSGAAVLFFVASSIHEVRWVVYAGAENFRWDVESGDSLGAVACRVATEARRVAPVGHRRKIDRKSTRLNSSHVKISYAVFCLKKKK